ncbi:hypothetical protein [Natrinema salaciae]|uniref:hypothetical protein n=1 Tax=Natrinema salaciae TaxID=1186196 RepID=UPI001FDFC68B|nr:hypothetical protein [Natrinema salaciae]
MKTTAGTLAVGVGSVAAAGSASASHSGIGVGDQVQVWGDANWVPGWENGDRSGDWEKIYHSWAGYVQETNTDDGTNVYKVDWHKLDQDWWVAETFVREI